MAGIGKYKKGAKFTLKSGNKIDPEAFFKGEVKINPSQESGIYYKSPLEKDDEEKEDIYDPYNVSGDKDEKDKTKDEKERVEPDTPDTPDTPGTKAWKVAANALIGGFDAISGMRTKRPKINFGKYEEEEAADSPEDKMKRKEEEGTTFNWKNEDGTDKTIEEYNKWWDDKNKKEKRAQNTET